jgi:biopolymer transport protein ExbD
MAFQGIGRSSHSEPVAEINMIPLIDVMLVLLVIFIVAAPLLTHAVQLQLPRASSQAETGESAAIHLSIQANGQLLWNEEPLSTLAWQERLATLAKTQPDALLRLSADADLAYKHVALVLADAARLGLSRIALVTDPRPERP